MRRYRQLKTFRVTKQSVVTYTYTVRATSMEFAKQAPIPVEARRTESTPTNGYVELVEITPGYSPPGYE